MKFNLDSAQLFVPDGLADEAALARTTHLGIGAHQDDLEIMAIDGILACFQREDKWFTGVVMTDGSGAPRAALYQDYPDAEMRTVRAKEQIAAAVIGEYAAQVLLDYPSAVVRDSTNHAPTADIIALLRTARPEIVYTHNLADTHDTHVSVALRVIAAIRSLPRAERPRRLYGCEVWRDLDWLCDADKVAFDCSAYPDLQTALLGIFASQVRGGKRYDLATMGRRRAHATYHTAHGADAATALTFAMDLTPLITAETAPIAPYVQGFIDRFAQDVGERLARLGVESKEDKSWHQI